MSDRRIDVAPSRGPVSPLLSLLFGGQRAGGRGGSQVYMLLDTAHDQRIHVRLMELAEPVHTRSLYQGDIGESLAHVSPYLLSLREDQPESHWFAEAGFGQSWGLFIIAPIGFDELRRHLRKFNIVYRENGTPLVFRFYDPRVLRRFLPTCTPDELGRFFGPIESFLTETEEADALLHFTWRGDELMQTRLPVPA
jgi:Domain of unknown function (DUF4123)